MLGHSRAATRRKPSGLRLAVAVLAGALLVVVTGAAQAAMPLEVIPPEARPGEEVVVRTLARVAYSEGRRIPVYLAVAAEITSSTDAPPKLVRLGDLTVQPSERAELRARVPNVPAGAYRLVVYVEGSHPAYWPAGKLGVLPPLPGTWAWLAASFALYAPAVALAVGALLLLGAVLLAAAVRRRKLVGPA